MFFLKRTALHWAVKRNHIELVKYLLIHGASNDILNSDGRKPSFYAKETQLKRILSMMKLFKSIK